MAAASRSTAECTASERTLTDPVTRPATSLRSTSKLFENTESRAALVFCEAILLPMAIPTGRPQPAAGSGRDLIIPHAARRVNRARGDARRVAEPQQQGGGM